MKKGKFVLEAIQEGEGEFRQRLYFNPPLVIDFQIVEQVNEKDGVENIELMGYATFDFGMEIHMPLDVEKNVLINGYEGLTKESDPIDILMKSICFDLFHAFFHDCNDASYSYYHWSLQGWLQERSTIKESE